MNKTVVVTGASQGLGFCLVKEGIKRGYVVYALDINTNDELTVIQNRLKIHQIRQKNYMIWQKIQI